MALRTSLIKAAPVMLSITRIVVGFLVLWHGLIKIFGFPEGQLGGAVPVMSLMGLTGLIELVGGALMMLGLFTRPAAAVIFLDMTISYFVLNLPQGFWSIRNDGEAAMLYAVFFLFVATAGAGTLAVDRLLNRKSEVSPASQLASPAAGITLAIMRIFVAFMFIQHGLQKYMGAFGSRADHNWGTTPTQVRDSLGTVFSVLRSGIFRQLQSRSPSGRTCQPRGLACSPTPAVAALPARDGMVLIAATCSLRGLPLAATFGCDTIIGLSAGFAFFVFYEVSRNSRHGRAHLGGGGTWVPVVVATLARAAPCSCCRRGRGWRRTGDQGEGHTGPCPASLRSKGLVVAGTRWSTGWDAPLPMLPCPCSQWHRPSVYARDRSRPDHQARRSNRSRRNRCASRPSDDLLRRQPDRHHGQGQCRGLYYYQRPTLLAAACIVRSATGHTLRGRATCGIKDPDGAVVPTAHITLTDDFRDGFVDGACVSSPRTRRAIVAGKRRRAKPAMSPCSRTGWFTPCKICEEDPTKPPTWRIRAGKITHSATRRPSPTAMPVFDFFGVPSVWVPTSRAPTRP